MNSGRQATKVTGCNADSTYSTPKRTVEQKCRNDTAHGGREGAKTQMSQRNPARFVIWRRGERGPVENDQMRKLPQRPPKPAWNRGRLQMAARRVLGDGTTTTAIAASYGYALKLHQRRGLTPRDYEAMRRALRQVGGVPIGRAGGRGRPTIWRFTKCPLTQIEIIDGLGQFASLPTQKTTNGINASALPEGDE